MARTLTQRAAPDTAGFGRWYAPIAERSHLDPNPSDPRHFYDYVGAFLSGAKPDSTGHLPSEFKRLGHPRLILNGIDTRSGKRATPALVRANTAANAAVMSKYKED